MRHLISVGEAAARQIQTAYVEPGKSWQNGVSESFNSRLRDECLNLELLY